MQRRFIVLGFIFLAFLSTRSYASGDFGCAPPRATIFLHSYQPCNSVPFLSPANDSRLNLELLLIDAGRLSGSLHSPPEFPLLRDMAWLKVPFDFEDWQVNERALGAAVDNAAKNKTDSNEYAQGEGSRCNSAQDGLAAFENAVKAAGAQLKEDALVLIAARRALTPNCNATTNSDWKVPQAIHSTLGHEFAAYIAGANAFYAGDFSAALTSFKSIENSANPWLKETSRYMLGRTFLNSAQLHAFGEWGELKIDTVDKSILKDAENAFDAYLQDFPHGIYAASSRGLLRRVYWLGDDEEKLAEAFDRALADSEKGANNVTLLELVQEADAKLLASVKIERVQSPQFLAIIDLMRMRSTDEKVVSASLTLEDLEKQEDRFVHKPALYQYLLASFYLYAEPKPEKALDLLPNLTGKQLSYFDFSQQTLRALALDASKQYDAERKLLQQMLPLARLPLQSEQLQLVLAELEERTGHLGRVFAPGSPIHEKAIRTILVEYSASAEMLRQRAKDPSEDANVIEASLYTLLYKELTGGKFQAFQTDLAIVGSHPSEFLAPFVDTTVSMSSEYRCPSLRDVAATMQRDGNDARSLNCMGELIRLHGVHFGQDDVPPETDLGGSNSLFPVTGYSRMDGYLKVIANHQAEGAARAYALYRAVQCYAPSGYNSCGKQDIPLDTRKQWFQMLHKEYPDTAWAKSSKYYW